MARDPEPVCNKSWASAWRMALSLRIIVVISRTATAGFALMRLDQLAMDVDPDQGAVRADLNLHADIPTRRHRIQSAIQPHMVIGVNLAVDPVGWIETSG